MRRAQGTDAVVLVLALGGALLGSCTDALALDPALDVSQYVHTSWRVREGFGKGRIHAMAQTPDGYLWLGSEFGLLRFDGIRTVSWPEITGQDLPSSEIMNLLVARDGALWIGTTKGLVSWKDGRLTSYAELAGKYMFALRQDDEGTVWATGMAMPAGKLCTIGKGGVRCQGQDGRFGRAIFDLYEDARGNMWGGVFDGLWQWNAGAARFHTLPGRQTVMGFAEDDDGALLIGGVGGLLRLLEGRVEPFSRPGVARDLNVSRMLRDRDGGLWIGTSNRGLVHVRAGRADSFTRLDGLSGEGVLALLEDREGTLWVATDTGLDRFREPAVATLSERQGLASSAVYSVLAARDGSIWFTGAGGLNRWADGRFTIARTGSGMPDGKVDGLPPWSLFEDHDGRFWVSTLRGLGYLENERFTPVGGAPAGLVRSFAEDTAGMLWMANQEAGLVGVSPGKAVRQIPWTRLEHPDFATALIADHVRGGVWLGFYRGGIVHVRDGEVALSYTAADGLGGGYVFSFRMEADGTLWTATEGGLSRLKDGRLATLTKKNGLPCDTVQWVMDDDLGSTWLYTACGLVRVARSELEAWTAAVDGRSDEAAKRVLPTTVLDLADGVRTHNLGSGISPMVAKSPDGRLWFLPFDGVSVLDPRHLALNPMPPPVHVEEITADRKRYEPAPSGGTPLLLPALSRDLQIDYTALSLAAPEKVRFRYRLEGRDRDWQDAGTRRQAFYSDLGPGHYRFRMTASNNSGVWNEAGTYLDFAIAPAYYQRTWFRLACLAAFAGLLAALYRLRLRRVTRQVRMRMEVRLEERERIARDLHDTLLQSVQGLILKFDAVAKRIPRGDPARQAIDETLDRADEILAEGRDRVRSLRGTGAALSDLPAAFQRIAKEVTHGSATTFRSVVEGRARDLDPTVLEESFSIGREALLNALSHSGALHVELEIAYDARQFRLRIRDDGRGIDPEILGKGGRADHWGLQGMRERARRVGASLELWSRPGAGTEVELKVPAATAYRSTAATRWFRRSAGP